jgi:hypothetical protein
MATIIVNGMNCDTDCDCKVLQDIKQKEISKINIHLRRLEASQKLSTETNNKASSKGDESICYFIIYL